MEVPKISKSDIKKWLEDLVKDIKSPEYKLFLIGQCDKSANTFIKSIEKFSDRILDEETKISLNGFNTDLIENKRICFSILPFDIEVLEKIVRDSLHRYISIGKQMVNFEQISFIASATLMFFLYKNQLSTVLYYGMLNCPLKGIILIGKFQIKNLMKINMILH